MKNIIALMIFTASLAVSCSHDKPKNVAPADYAETEQKLIKNKQPDSATAAANASTTANGYKIPADSANSTSK